MGGAHPGGTGARPLTAAAPGLLPRLMLVTDRHETQGRDLVDVVEAAVAGGVGLVQLRERDLPEAETAALLRRLIDRLRGTPASLLVNGHPALARAFGPAQCCFAAVHLQFGNQGAHALRISAKFGGISIDR